ncbi:RBR-type E3 ubiquitin transferase [Ranunculus cassubicifolius]
MSDDGEDYLEDNYSDYSDNYSLHDSDDGMEEEENNEVSSASKAPRVQVITKESLLIAQGDDLRRVMDMLEINEQHARTLLIHHMWNVEKILEVLGEEGKDRLYAQAGVVVMEGNKDVLGSSDSTCYVCMEDGFKKKKMTTMDCGHRFCNSCWTEHFIVKINEGQSRRIQCMAYKCYAVCDEAVVRKLVNKRNPNLAERFERFLLESYIDDHKLVKWCPSVPHCGNAIRVDDDNECYEVECVCGHEFCFNCSSEAHSPCSCLIWELWMKKSNDDSETTNYFNANTKPCPKCKKACEKNGGCNHVVCVCKQAFCWLCGEATGMAHSYASIDGHSCGRFKEEYEKKAKSAGKDLKRYIHYYGRYKAHLDSFKLESKLKETLQQKITTSLGDDGETVTTTCEWLKDGLYRLLRSRKILAYSYASAFFMFGDLFRSELSTEEINIKKTLFEDQQQQFESYIEALSKHLEGQFEEFDKDKLNDMRLQVINLCVISDTRCKSMYECIENDLLGVLQSGVHQVAPYRSKGIAKASEVNLKPYRSISPMPGFSSHFPTGETLAVSATVFDFTTTILKVSPLKL